MGVPVFIGKNGIESILQIEFDVEEQAIFDKSAEAVNGLISAMKKVLG